MRQGSKGQAWDCLTVRLHQQAATKARGDALRRGPPTVLFLERGDGDALLNHRGDVACPVRNTPGSRPTRKNRSVGGGSSQPLNSTPTQGAVGPLVQGRSWREREEGTFSSSQQAFPGVCPLHTYTPPAGT